MATESRKHETSDKLTVQSLAWAVWQVLGWDWGLNPGKEKSRICNWFWDVSRGEDRPLSELFPLGGEQRLSDAQPKVLEARPGVSTAVEGNTVDKSVALAESSLSSPPIICECGHPPRFHEYGPCSRACGCQRFVRMASPELLPTQLPKEK